MTRLGLATVALLLAGAAASAALAAAPPRLAAVPISRMNLPWWRERFEQKQRELRQDHINLVWYGDSIIADFEKTGPEPWRDFRPVWDRFYGSRHAINLGFKGDTTASLLWRVEHGEAEGIHPKLAIVLIGANNFGRVHWPAEPTLRGIEADIDSIRERLPETKILLLSVLPSERSAWVSEQTAEVNHLLAQTYPPGGDVTFLDVTGVFMKDGKLNRSLFLDPLLSPPESPLHPTAEGQARLAAAIEPTVAAVLGDRRH